MLLKNNTVISNTNQLLNKMLKSLFKFDIYYLFRPILCDILWFDTIFKKKTFETCGIKLFLDICMVKNYFIEGKKVILKVNYFQFE